MSRYTKIFHPHHCLMLQLKARLTKAYGSEEGFLRHQMDHEEVKRKLEVRLETLNPNKGLWLELNRSMLPMADGTDKFDAELHWVCQSLLKSVSRPD